MAFFQSKLSLPQGQWNQAQEKLLFDVYQLSLWTFEYSTDEQSKQAKRWTQNEGGFYIIDFLAYFKAGIWADPPHREAHTNSQYALSQMVGWSRVEFEFSYIIICNNNSFKTIKYVTHQFWFIFQWQNILLNKINL